jgi:hypothetical protein
VKTNSRTVVLFKDFTLPTPSEGKQILMYITVVVEVCLLPFPLATTNQRVLDDLHLALLDDLHYNYTRNDTFLETVSLSGWKAEGQQTIKIELWGEALYR